MFANGFMEKLEDGYETWYEWYKKERGLNGASSDMCKHQLWLVLWTMYGSLVMTLFVY